MKHLKKTNCQYFYNVAPNGALFSLHTFFYHNVASNEAFKSTVGTKVW